MNQLVPIAAYGTLIAAAGGSPRIAYRRCSAPPRSDSAAARARRESGPDRPLLERIVQCRLWPEEVAPRQHECRHEPLQEHQTGRLIEPHSLILSGVAGLAKAFNNDAQYRAFE